MAHSKAVSHRGFALTWVALMALALASFGLSFVHLGRLAVPVALAIACVKAALVALFFMELVEQRFTNRMVVVTALLFVALIVGLTTADVLTREPPPLEPAVRY